MATTNMGLTLPVVSSTLGPAWASQLNAALELVDAHDHSSGKGKQITSAGINVNADLSFSGYAATLLKSADFLSQATTLVGGPRVYVVNGDLYYNNGSGVPVQVTVGPAVAGSTGSIDNLTSPAKAVWTGTFFGFYADYNTTLAPLKLSSVELCSSALAANGSVTVSAPAGMAPAASYNLKVPAAVPAGAGGFLMMRASGQQEYSYPDGTTIEENPSGTIKVKTISNANIANSSISTEKINSFFDYFQNTSGIVYNYNMPAGEVVLLTKTFTVPNNTNLKISLQPPTQVNTPPTDLSGWRMTVYNNSASVPRNFHLYIKLTKSDGFTHYYDKRAVIRPGVELNLDPFFVQEYVPAGTTTVSCCVTAATPSDLSITIQNLAFMIISP